MILQLGQVLLDQSDRRIYLMSEELRQFFYMRQAISQTILTIFKVKSYNVEKRILHI